MEKGSGALIDSLAQHTELAILVAIVSYHAIASRFWIFHGLNGIGRPIDERGFSNSLD